MDVLNTLGNHFLQKRLRQLDEMKCRPFDFQEQVFGSLLEKGKNTAYGRDHGFRNITNSAQFREQVPVVSYEDLLPYLDRLLKGEKNVLWPGRIDHLAKSSGTTGSKSKILPVSPEGLRSCHYQGGRDMLALYFRRNPASKIFSGKNLSIGGSQESSFSGRNNKFYLGNISAIVMKNLPFWAQLGRTPELRIALMNDWEKKVEEITKIAPQQKITSLAGSPMWMLLLLQNIQNKLGIEYLQEIWPGLEVFFHGSVSFSPYKPLFEQLDRDNNLHYLEIYNATEGFFGMQDQAEDNSLLLMLNYGIFYEFIPEENFDDENPEVIPLSEVKTDKKYSLVISTNSGLWRYKIGDTIKFTSVDPYRFLICGRTRHGINIFGEDLFTEHGEKALAVAAKKTGAILQNFTAAPSFYGKGEKGFHEWLIEFQKAPSDLQKFTHILDEELCNLNEDYRAKRKQDTAIGKPLVREVPAGTFYDWLKRKGKLGGQHKIPAMSNSREFLEELLRCQEVTP